MSKPAEFKTTRIEIEILDSGTYATVRRTLGPYSREAWVIESDCASLPRGAQWPASPADDPELAKTVLGDAVEVYLNYRDAVRRAEQQLVGALEAIAKYAQTKADQR